MRKRALPVFFVASAFALALPAALVLNPLTPNGGPTEAQAAVSILMSLDELVGAAPHVVVATAGERRSVWEDLPGGRRIVTYTRLKVERAVVGSTPSEIEVRTLGGVVGGIGQLVAGDAKIAKGERALLFLAKAESAFVVAGLAQGHYPIAPDTKGTPRLKMSPDAGSLVPRRGPVISAREVLAGTTVDDAIAAVAQARRARDGR